MSSLLDFQLIHTFDKLFWLTMLWTIYEIIHCKICSLVWIYLTWFNSHHMKSFIYDSSIYLLLSRTLSSSLSQSDPSIRDCFHISIWIKSHRLISVHQFNCGEAYGSIECSISVSLIVCLFGIIRPIEC